MTTGLGGRCGRRCFERRAQRATLAPGTAGVHRRDRSVDASGEYSGARKRRRGGRVGSILCREEEAARRDARAV